MVYTSHDTRYEITEADKKSSIGNCGGSSLAARTSSSIFIELKLAKKYSVLLAFNLSNDQSQKSISLTLRSSSICHHLDLCPSV
jgi:hypothetical protein